MASTFTGSGDPEDSLAITQEASLHTPTFGVDDTLASPREVTLPGGLRDERDDLARGDLIGRYVILDRLGAGGMGVVYAAFDPELDRKVAIKLLHSSAAAESEGSRMRLLREAQALAKLSHPNVVTIHDVGTFGDHVWLAMEHVEGRTLGAWRRARARRWQEILAVVLDAGRGLAAAHAAGLIHRDVKPENIMVGVDGRVRMMDFGLARATGGDDEPPRTLPERALATSGDLAVLSLRITQAGSMMGTPAYMSPESLSGAEADARSDLFGFCATLWEALYGETPFAGRTLSELTTNVEGGKLRPIPRGSTVPGWVRRLCERGLAADPGQRPPSIDALLADFARGQGRSRRWRWIAVAGALALASGAGLGWRAIELEAKRARCEAAGAAIDEAWNDAARERLRRGLLDSGAPIAEDVNRRMHPWLDAWTASWRETRSVLCRAAEIDGAWSPDLYERAQSCLDEQRDGLVGLLEGLADAPPGSVWYAVPIAAGLPRVDACTERALLERRPPPPPEAVRDQVAELRRRLMVVIGLHEAGRFTEAMTRAEALLADVQALGDPPLEIQVRVQVGGLASSLGDLERAEAMLTDVFVDAGALGMDEVAVDAANRLIFTVGYRAARHREGLLWSRAAEMLIRRLGQAKRSRGATVLNSVANIHYALGDYEASQRLFEEALAINEAELGESHPLVADNLTNLADVFYARGELDRAEATYARSLAISAETLGPLHPNRGYALNNLATVHYSRGELEEARPLLEQALTIFEATYGPDNPELANTLNNLANIDRVSGALDRARARYGRAVALIEGSLGGEHPALATPLDNLGTVHWLAGEPDEAAPLFARALQIREAALGPEHPEVATSLLHLAEVQLADGDLAAASAGFARARAIREAALGAENAGVGEALAGLAEVALAEGRVVDARAGLEDALTRLKGDAPSTIAAAARARFALARALSRPPAADPTRARALAEAARDALRESPSERRALLVIEAWLRDQGGSAAKG
ncbi:MAG: serine/threonine protein kinase [Myxococcales bacterium]|nr:serine/threonine protein kinase [Myxococcales bacterium]